MRVTLCLFLILTAGITNAQHHPGNLGDLPRWMADKLRGDQPAPKTKQWKPTGAPIHKNAFVGTWVMRAKNGKQLRFWGDAYRMMLSELNSAGEVRRTTVVDLAANVRLETVTREGRTMVRVQDLFIPQAGYFRELWNDSVHATGRVETVMGKTCNEMVGYDGNKDTTIYYTTDLYPELFADLRVWAQYLQEGPQQFLSAFSDKNAGGSLKVKWMARKYSTDAGEMEFLEIEQGAVPMPEFLWYPNSIEEERFQWVNSSGLGRLPGWMRERVNNLPVDALPVLYTPAPVDRGIPNNAFIGTLTAETPTNYINEHRDTTLQIAIYSYWADERRAILQLHDPDGEGTVVYMVDLDADVVIAAVNEGHGYVIPKLYVGDLQAVGLAEFGAGVDVTLTPTGKFRKILNRKCQLHTANEPRYLSYFWLSNEKQNPVFDMARWMEERVSKDFKDLFFFGLKDQPMPFAVMGTHLTEYKPGKAKPPALDLSNYRVIDQRLRQERNAERERNQEPEIERVIIEYDTDPDMLEKHAPMAIPEGEP